MLKIEIAVTQGLIDPSAHARMSCCGAALNENLECGCLECLRCRRTYPLCQVQAMLGLAAAQLAGLEQLLADLMHESLSLTQEDENAVYERVRA